MRRWTWITLGVLEVAGAVAMIALALGLPGSSDVRQARESALRTTAAASEQVRLLRDQVEGLRASSLDETTDRLEQASRALAVTLRGRTLDADKLAALRDATARAADGLDRAAASFDPAALGSLANGMDAAARLIDDQIVPASRRAADALTASTASLQTSSARFAALLRGTTPDLKPLVTLNDGLGQFEQGLGAVKEMLNPQAVAGLQIGLAGVSGTVKSVLPAAEQVASLSYPVPVLNGLVPSYRMQRLIANGPEIVDQIRQAIGVVDSINAVVAKFAARLPAILSAMDASRQAIAASRQVLTAALANREAVEGLLKEMTEQSARLAEDLPGLTGNLAEGLRSVATLGPMADALRRAGAGLRAGAGAWPEVQGGLKATAALLRASSEQVGHVIDQRANYEANLDQFAGLAESSSRVIAGLGDGLETRLDRERLVLTELGRGIDQTGRLLPAWTDAATAALHVARALALLLAAGLGVHGLSLLAAARERALHTGP
jgi:ABC-type transporter Mla subunit MlaD